MQARRNPRQGRHELRFQGVEIAGVDQVGLEFAQQAVELPVPAERMAGRLVQVDKCHIVALDPVTELGMVGQADDHMAKTFARQAVDQVDQAVLQAAGAEVVDHMGEQRGSAHFARSSTASSAGLWAARNSASKALACSTSFLS